MDMRARVATALKQAIKEKAAARVATLRLINAAIKDREIAQRCDGEEAVVGDDEILAILGKMVKQRQESARAYEEGGRLDLAERDSGAAAMVDRLVRNLSRDQDRKAFAEWGGAGSGGDAPSGSPAPASAPDGSG